MMITVRNTFKNLTAVKRFMASSMNEKHALSI